MTQNHVAANLLASYEDEGVIFLKSHDNLEIVKGRHGEPVGSKKQWGGKDYIKTATGWKPVGKNGGAAKAAHDYVHGASEKKDGEVHPHQNVKDIIAYQEKYVKENESKNGTGDSFMVQDYKRQIKINKKFLSDKEKEVKKEQEAKKQSEEKESKKVNMIIDGKEMKVTVRKENDKAAFLEFEDGSTELVSKKRIGDNKVEKSEDDTPEFIKKQKERILSCY